MKLFWGNSLDTAMGNAYGYSVHYRSLRAALDNLGVETTFASDVAVHITPANNFKPIPGKRNLLYCLSPGTRVLTADLQWIPIELVRAGDKLVGFDEKLGVHNQYREATVEETTDFIGDVYEIETTHGKIRCSGNHQWVCTNAGGGIEYDKKMSNSTNRGTHARKWVRTDKLKPGIKLVKQFNLWDEADTAEIGWMSGVLDGEGTVSSREQGGNIVAFAQKSGDVLDRAIAILNKYGFEFNVDYNHKANCFQVRIFDNIRALGFFRPVRLMKKAGYLWRNKRTYGPITKDYPTVLSVKLIGPGRLIGTKTSTGTLIAEGILSHNTMYECTTLPPTWKEKLDQADAIIVPCRQNRDLFRQYTKRPIYVVHEGCDTELYQYHERSAPGPRQPFTFLWVGAPNLRKGFAHLGQAWTMWMIKHPDLVASGKTRLYMKSSGIAKGDDYQFKPEWGITVDPKSTPGAPMRDIYNEAHAFVLPSMGEGWGLTLIEAAATGLPCIYTPWSGPRDFMDERYSYPVKWKFGHVRTMKKVGGVNYLDQETDAAHADPKSIFQRMEQIYYGYDEALRRGKKMSEIIHREFTWEQSALRFCEVIREIAARNNLDIGEHEAAAV